MRPLSAVDGQHDRISAGQVNHAVHHDGRRRHTIGNWQIGRPGQTKIAHVLLVDLGKRRVVPAGEIATFEKPVFAGGGFFQYPCFIDVARAGSEDVIAQTCAEHRQQERKEVRAVSVVGVVKEACGDHHLEFPFTYALCRIVPAVSP